MFIVDFVQKLWSKGKTVSRLDFNSYYRKFAYPTPFIERHKSAPGVNAVLKKLKTAHDKFKEQRAQLQEREQTKEKDKFTTWKTFHIIKVVSKRVFLIGLILFIVSCILSTVARDTFAGFGNMVMGVMLLITPVPFIFKVLEKITELFYEKYSHCISDELIAIRLQYLKIENACREEMDELCLASLSDLERAQELQHREMIAIQEKNAEAISSQLKKMRKENKANHHAIKEDLRKFKERMGIED